MDETTLSDLRQRVARWQKEWDLRGKPAANHEAERAWCFAVNIDDVTLLFQALDRLTQENETLRLQLFQAKEQLAPNTRWFYGWIDDGYGDHFIHRDIGDGQSPCHYQCGATKDPQPGIQYAFCPTCFPDKQPPYIAPDESPHLVTLDSSALEPDAPPDSNLGG